VMRLRALQNSPWGAHAQQHSNDSQAPPSMAVPRRQWDEP